jgi:hypothetical protein
MPRARAVAVGAHQLARAREHVHHAAPLAVRQLQQVPYVGRLARDGARKPPHALARVVQQRPHARHRRLVRLAPAVHSSARERAARADAHRCARGDTCARLATRRITRLKPCVMRPNA